MTTVQQLVVGVFRDRAQAEQAVDELLRAGFDNRQIRFAAQGASTGGVLEKIKSVFTGQDTLASGIYDELTSLGVSPEDARYYQSEFEAGHSIVAVMGTGRMQDAAAILARYGGYSAAHQHSAQSAPYGQGAGVQEPSSRDVNTEYNRRQFQQQEARTMQEPQQTATSNTYYNLVSTLYHALETEQTCATYVQDAQQSGNQDLAQFFSDVQQNASRQADQAKQLLARASSNARSFGSTPPEENRSFTYPGAFPAN